MSNNKLIEEALEIAEQLPDEQSWEILPSRAEDPEYSYLIASRNVALDLPIVQVSMGYVQDHIGPADCQTDMTYAIFKSRRVLTSLTEAVKAQAERMHYLEQRLLQSKTRFSSE